jgi:hypothetical protein
LGRRLALLDNVKKLRYSCSELECLITSDVISGRQLYVGEGRRPNTLTWAITLNGANLSSDLAQRCIIVKVARPEYSATWEEEATAFIEANRWGVVGDILAALRESAAPLARHSRWGAWEDAVLARVGDPSECQKVIEERQAEVDDDKAEAATVGEYFAAQLRHRGRDPERSVVFIPSQDAAEWVCKATNQQMPVNRASAFLRTLRVKGLRKSDRGEGRGWVWTGCKSEPGQEAVALPDRPWSTVGGDR